MLKHVMKNPHKVLPQLLAAAIGSWGFFCTGLVRGWSSPGIPSLNATKNFEIESSDVAWIASMPPLCALVGALLVSYPMQHFGRRRTLIGLSIPFFIGFLLMGLTYFGRHKAMLYVGRLMTGLVNGALTPSSQIYISECSSPRIRGVLSSLTASALALGILTPYIIGAFVDWWVLALILIVFPVLLFTGMIFMPETPIWLMAHKHEDEARRALQRLRGKRTDVDAEFLRIKENQEKSDKKKHKIQPRELLKGSVLKPLSISLGIMFFQQSTGINAMVFYTVNIFKSAGSSIDGRYATIIVGVVQLIATAFSGFFVDRYGRRILLLGSAVIVSCSLAAMGSFFYMQEQWGAALATEKLGWLPLLSLVVFFIAYSGGYANVPFILMGELFPARYRSILGPLSSSFNLCCTFIVVRSFPVMQVTMTKYGAFWFFMCCTLVGIAFVYFLLPETKGKTLEDIEKIFSAKYDATGTLKTTEAQTDENSLEVKVPAALSGDIEMNKSNDGALRQHKTKKNGNVALDNGNQITTLALTPIADSEDEEDGSLVMAPL
ncbi:facilitated trehalose transporter Tret1-2 homolog [Daphnia carinata]|uniref:facilitated trehalose transporter Tret1-2 homolog n=1 Tax=Daphnia carinata TaxID=120202 RepID=UPI00257F2651|nr:facilitated trehalose transporter Tret1-2 homolog [Daphnia carinata]